MEAVASERGAKGAAFGATAARVVVQSSIVLSIAAGCWLLESARPGHGVIAAAAFLSATVLARWRFEVASTIVLFFAFTSVGLMLTLWPAYPPGPLWSAAVAGLVVGGCSWTAWRAPVTWRWALMLWLLGVALSWPIIAAREADLTLALSAGRIGPILAAALITLCSGLWLDAALTWDLDTIERRIGRPLLASVVVSAIVVLYQAFVDITWASGEPWISARRAPGLMADPNPMAVAAALLAPIAPFVFRGRLRLALGPVVTLLLWVAAWLTGARSVILLVGAGAIGLVAGFVASRTTPRRAALVAAGAVFVAAIAVILLARMPAAGPISRLAATLPLDRPTELAYEVLWRRDGYGLAAARAIREQPLSGVGHGAFNFLSSYYHQLEGGPLLPADNAQNLWRHALAERGLLAFAAVIALTVATLRLLLRQRVAAISLVYTWTLKAIVIGFGLALMFGLPIQNPAIALTAASLLAWLHAAVAAPSASRSRLTANHVAIIWLLAIAGAGVDAWNARSDLRPAWRAARIGEPYLAGFGDAESSASGVSGRVVTGYAVVALRPSAPRFHLRYWVRGTDARHVRVWQNQRLVFDELLPAGVIIERSLESPVEGGMLLEFETAEPGIVVAGEFVDSGGTS